MPASSRQVLLATAAVLASVLSLGIGTSLAKQLFPVLGAQGTSALRVGFSALALLLVFRPWRWFLSMTDRWSILRYGLCLGLMNLCFYMALRTIPFGLAVAIEFAGPLSIALLGMRRRSDMLWIALAVVGLAMLLPWQGVDSALDPVGVMYALAAAVFWALYIVYGKQAGHLPTGVVVGWGMTCAALVVVPVGIAHAGTALLTPSLLAFGLMVAVISSAIPISLEMVALKRIPKETFGVLISTEPAVAATLGWIFLSEHLSGLQWAAIVCVMCASIGCALTASKTVSTLDAQTAAA